jgi:DNA-binding transcriptional MerR regulator
MYESNGYGLKFYLEDGHYRYFAAKTLNKKTFKRKLRDKGKPYN